MQVAGCTDDQIVALLNDETRLGPAPRRLTTTLSSLQTARGRRADSTMPPAMREVWAGGTGKSFPNKTVGGTPINYNLTGREAHVRLVRTAINQGEFDSSAAAEHTINHMTLALKKGKMANCTECGQPMRDRGDGVMRCLRGCANPCVA